MPLMTLKLKFVKAGVCTSVGMLALTLNTVVAGEQGDANEAAFVSMGYAMAMQMRLNAGFSEQELDQIFKGMSLAAAGADEPEGFQDAIQQAQGIYMQRMQELQIREQQEAQQLAAGNKAEGAAFLAALDEDEGIQKTDSGLRYRVIEEGTGESPGPNDRVVVSYRGTLIDGREFDSNGGAEFAVNGVVPGFGEGLQLMREGGKIKLYIPSDLAYGDGPQRPGSIIEPGSTLIFDVQLVRISPPQGSRPAMTPPPGARPQGGPPAGGPPRRDIPPPPNYTPPPPPTHRPEIPEQMRRQPAPEQDD